MVIRERMFRGWLASMWEDQAGYGKRFDEMTDEEGQAYLTQMALALQVEVSEFIEEFQWKYWKTKTEQFPIRNDRAKVLGEAADVLHFLAHMLNMAGVTEEELNEAMYQARLKNEKRRSGEYSY